MGYSRLQRKIRTLHTRRGLFLAVPFMYPSFIAIDRNVDGGMGREKIPGPPIGNPWQTPYALLYMVDSTKHSFCWA